MKREVSHLLKYSEDNTNDGLMDITTIGDFCNDNEGNTIDVIMENMLSEYDINNYKKYITRSRKDMFETLSKSIIEYTKNKKIKHGNLFTSIVGDENGKYNTKSYSMKKFGFFLLDKDFRNMFNEQIIKKYYYVDTCEVYHKDVRSYMDYDTFDMVDLLEIFLWICKDRMVKVTVSDTFIQCVNNKKEYITNVTIVNYYKTINN